MLGQYFRWWGTVLLQTTSKFLALETRVSEHTQNLFYVFINISDDSRLIEVILKDVKELPCPAVCQSAGVSFARTNNLAKECKIKRREIYLLMSSDLICPNNSDKEEESLNLLVRFASTIMNTG